MQQTLLSLLQEVLPSVASFAAQMGLHSPLRAWQSDTLEEKIPMFPEKTKTRTTRTITTRAAITMVPRVKPCPREPIIRDYTVVGATVGELMQQI